MLALLPRVDADGSARLGELPEPTPQKGEVLVDVKASGPNTIQGLPVKIN